MSSTIFEKNGTLLTVKPEGRVDTATAPALETEMAAYLDGVTNVVMDFRKVEYISSGGLRVLLTTQQALEDLGGGVKVIHVNDYILSVLDMVGFTDVLEVVPDSGE